MASFLTAFLKLVAFVIVVGVRAEWRQGRWTIYKPGEIRLADDSVESAAVNLPDSHGRIKQSNCATKIVGDGFRLRFVIATPQYKALQNAFRSRVTLHAKRPGWTTLANRWPQVSRSVRWDAISGFSTGTELQWTLVDELYQIFLGDLFTPTSFDNYVQTLLLVRKRSCVLRHALRKTRSSTISNKGMNGKKAFARTL